MDPPHIDGLPDRDARRERGEKLREDGVLRRVEARKRNPSPGYALPSDAPADGAATQEHPDSAEAFIPFFEDSWTLREANTGMRISLLRCQHPPDGEDYNGMDSLAPASFYGDDSQLHVHIDTELDLHMVLAAYLEVSHGPYRLAFLRTEESAHYDRTYCERHMLQYPRSFLSAYVNAAYEREEPPCDTLLANALPETGLLQLADIGVLVQAQGRRALEFIGANIPDEEGEQRARVNLYCSRYAPTLLDGMIAACAPWDVTPKLPEFRDAARKLLRRRPL